MNQDLGLRILSQIMDWSDERARASRAAVASSFDVTRQAVYSKVYLGGPGDSR